MLPDFDRPAPYLIALLICILAYFLREAHTRIKIDLEKTATREALDKATSEWREDLKEDRDRHQREMQRLETHYEQKFAGAVNDLHKQIGSLKAEMKDRMDLILKLLERNENRP
jgi:Skp family chaperone for outer membrane proteins